MLSRWWLFHATDFHTLMRPCFTVCRIVGMFPYKINASTFEISLPRYILSTVVVCFYCVFYLLFIHDAINFEIFDDFDDVTVNIEDVFFFTFNGLIVIATHILSNPRMRLLQTISEIYSKLSLESHQRLSRLIHTKDILGIILTVMKLLFFCSIENLEMNYWDVLFRVFEIYLYMLGFQMNMLYMNCICVLKASFQKINNDLMHIQSDVINDMKPSVSSLICHMQRNQFFLIEIKTLMKQHLMVSETVQKLNLIFSLQLLATVIITFFEITFELYEYVDCQDGIYLYFDIKQNMLSMMDMMCIILQIILIVWACETGKNQAKEIGTTVCNVLNATRDEQIKGKLKLFSLQILHQKNAFLVKGLTVDATFLTTMVGSITTYVLILIQFCITYSCNKTSVINT